MTDRAVLFQTILNTEREIDKKKLNGEDTTDTSERLGLLRKEYEEVKNGNTNI